ncbi:bifunctional ADP-dependent NAD(P)H-hydrate dehydratase/NAD(P)H-hydrate epimerase [Nitrospira moscoviensis]|uniref:Bifunctional NAD(P)H-hydrate repair enzyme n=1 Tax=Nitrospira moscoviensis TaxID=42253 RepID=A0A0K2GIS6_NITMO|nr:bifunctional ADP-dependent NAD(P)H-hydrate dehydratase/NAD(P)H-hydrate epimerase [Nitrospira moscoviensis]ALA60845.1 Bifunctional NAD(P)H-hydrate repair enzyme Nnr [Nitrospira moscoviensis]
MMKIITSAQMQALDRRTITEAGIPGKTLMERAGHAVSARLEEVFGSVRGKRVTVLCGKGNNGGDGFVVARLLHRKQAMVHVLAMASVAELTPDAASMYRQFTRVAGTSRTRPYSSTEPVHTLIRGSDLIVDALLGTGLSADVSGRYADAIDAINGAGRPVVAVDLPSGLHADTGKVLGHAVRAAVTVTFGLPKLGLYLNQGIDHAGQVTVADIGIPPSFIDEVDSRTTLVTGSFVQRTLPVRRPSSHKGTFGHAGLIAGSVGKTGAAAMAAQAALRVGAGLVTVAIPSSVNDVLEAKLLEAMTAPMPETKARTFSRNAFERLSAFIAGRTAVAIGPGLSTHPETVELVQSLVKQLAKPAVLDADALNALAGRASLLTECKQPPILTPHPGEMARLEPDATAQSVNADRIGTATRFARERGVFLVLKGARTVIARPDGAVAICPTGNPGMATAGTGDVLTGMTVGLLAQGLPPWEAACVATYLHGYAGDLTAAALGPAGMVAGDVIAQIPHALKACHEG